MEYDKELATRLLTETMRELPGYLMSQDEDDLWAEEFVAEMHMMRLFYDKLIQFWSVREYNLQKELLTDFREIAGAKEINEHSTRV